MLALTGIKERGLARLEKRGVTVLELISFANLRTASRINPGDRVFLTSDLYEELGKGSDGIVAEVVSVTIDPLQVSMEHIDEREIQRARIKLRFLSYGRVKDIRWNEEVPLVELIVLENQIIL